MHDFLHIPPLSEHHHINIVNFLSYEICFCSDNKTYLATRGQAQAEERAERRTLGGPDGNAHDTLTPADLRLWALLSPLESPRSALPRGFTMPAFGALPGAFAFTSLSLLQSERIKRFRDDEDAQQLSVQHPGADASQVGLHEEPNTCNGHQDDVHVVQPQRLNIPSATAYRRQRPASVARHCLFLRELYPARCAVAGCSRISGSRPPYSRLMDIAAAAAQASDGEVTSRVQGAAQHSAAHANGDTRVGVDSVS